MGANQNDRDAILKKVARPNTRSALFWWLFDNYDMVQAAADGRRLEWQDLCVSFGKQGITDRNGKSPTRITARKTWQRVRKEKAHFEARRAAAEADRVAKAAANPRRNMPSQFAKRNYAPPLALAPQTASTEEELWMGKYSFDGDGMIIVIDNPSSGVYAQQERNLRCSRPINDGIERFIKHKG